MRIIKNVLTGTFRFFLFSFLTGRCHSITRHRWWDCITCVVHVLGRHFHVNVYLFDGTAHNYVIPARRRGFHPAVVGRPWPCPSRCPVLSRVLVVVRWRQLNAAVVRCQRRARARGVDGSLPPRFLPSRTAAVRRRHRWTGATRWCGGQGAGWRCVDKLHFNLTAEHVLAVHSLLGPVQQQTETDTAG